jgi:hypothetical protein
MVGSIAGGVVGGIVFLGILVGLAVFFTSRRRRAQTAQSTADIYASVPQTTKEDSDNMTQFTATTPNFATRESMLKNYVSSDSLL